MLISNARSDGKTFGRAIVIHFGNIQPYYCTLVSPQNAPFLDLSFAIHTWLRLCNRPFAQGGYIFQVKKTFHFFKNDIGFINKLLDDLSVINLIAGAKVIRFAGWAAQV